MAKTKIKPADTWFSKCVRYSKNWTCERCGSVHEEGSMGIHTHHIVKRNVRRTRWDTMNAICVCFTCHRWIHDVQWESGPWLEHTYLGKGAFELLMEKKNGMVKVPVSEEKEIAAHYRKEYNRMVAENDNTFQSWQ